MSPVLRMATVRGLLKWLVSTGCKFPCDVSAFQFALPTLLKLQRGGIPGLVRAIGKYAVDQQTKAGARRLLETLLLSPSTNVSDARAALSGAQSFLGEVELAELWQLENQRTATLERAAAEKGGGGGGGGSAGGGAVGAAAGGGLEQDDVAAMPARQVAQALTHLRARQYAALGPADIVGFAMISPDPLSFELYPNVSEYVDFGNVLGRWGKELVVRASSRGVRAARIREFIFKIVFSCFSFFVFGRLALSVAE